MVRLILIRYLVIGVLGILSSVPFTLVWAESPTPSALLQVYKEEISETFTLKDLGQFEISNLRGKIRVEGWSQDKIKVKATKVVRASSPVEAKKLLSAMSFRYRKMDQNNELSVDYGKGLSLAERIVERRNPQSSMDMIVLAPAHLKLQVWGSDADVEVLRWLNQVQVRTFKGGIFLDKISAKEIQVTCTDCVVKANQIEGAFRCMAGDQKVTLSHLRVPYLFAETVLGDIEADDVEGVQLYVSQYGQLKAKNIRDQVEFHFQKGSVDIQEISGFVSGKTESGQINLGVMTWKFKDKAFLESVSGSIQVRMPWDFSAEVDLWSLTGKVENQFRTDLSVHHAEYGPHPSNRVKGRIGEGSEGFRMFSQSGDLKLLGALK